MTRWHVLLADPTGADGGTLTKWFADLGGMTAFDAQRLSRHAWGFLAENVSEAAARSAQEEAARRGLAARIFPEDRVPLPPDPSPVHGIKIVGGTGVWGAGSPPVDSASFSLAAIRLLSFVCLRRDTLVTKTVVEKASEGRRWAGLGILLATGIPLGLGGSQEVRSTVTSTDWIVFLDVHADGARWRISPDRFDFSALGSAKISGGPENLRRLAALLHDMAPEAPLGRGTRALLEGKPLSQSGYDGLDDVDKESRWLLAIGT